MTDLREAAQQALEALEFVGEDTPHWAAVKAAVKRTQAITALRAALEQPERGPPTDWEAVAADQAMTIALLLEALRLTSIDCQYLHHAHKDRHLLFEECPVVARINAAIAKAEGQP
ncbi:MAG: hypothetical protein ACOVOD_16700 [Rhodoferax sp.]